uniref:Transposase n=1 Tax=Ditylenchus dipsaci TaxID=166011 RepID=A0A915ED36_9BILA
MMLTIAKESEVHKKDGGEKTSGRRPVNKRFDPKYTKGTVKFGGGNIMVWGCFSWHGLGPLRLVNGKMDRFQYQQIFSETMLSHLEHLENSHPDENLIFQQDNDPSTRPRHHKMAPGQQRRCYAMARSISRPKSIENLWYEAERRMYLFPIILRCAIVLVPHLLKNWNRIEDISLPAGGSVIPFLWKRGIIHPHQKKTLVMRVCNSLQHASLPLYLSLLLCYVYGCVRQTTLLKE